MKYQNVIGDGKLPNKYFVFHYDEKFYNNDGEMETIEPRETSNDGLVGEYDTYAAALNAVEYKAFLPHVVIEDRLSGVIYEQYVEVCRCCGKEEYITIDDHKYTQETMEKKGLVFA